MTERSTPPILKACVDGSIRLTLNRPARANSLTPDLLDALLAALNDPEVESCNSIVLTGAGRAFSTGGDIGEFQSRAHDIEALTQYSDQIVSALNRVILKLASLPCPLIAAVNGPVTGGSLGLVLPADIVLMASQAFIQPYYARMGFAPDGGWTAILPRIIGRSKTMGWLALDHRLCAEELMALNIVDRVVDDGMMESAIRDVLATLSTLDLSSIKTAKRLLTQAHPDADLTAGLEAERIAFLAQISRPDTRERMAAFTKGRAHAHTSGIAS
jgi:2-(1,2-epoxy-1,2-dihydrophenyl)acetyl-CoA isomerase